ncbi:MAG: Gfo/Idh/MocA family oxidoreductase [Treponema sp.]|jgi:predicted dehydrogenase|nr:Gfo/Idh/MocA family oxidoreductase [Treponema sp.]
MQEKADGQNYAPQGRAEPVCGPGEFPVGVIGLDHGHIYGMCNGLSEAGADIALVWDPDPARVELFRKSFPSAKAAASKAHILEDASVKLIASAAIPADRCRIGIEAMDYGKDYFADKPPLVSREQLEQARSCVSCTGRKFNVYYSERLHVEAAVCAENLLAQGAIGKVAHVMGLGPHRLGAPSRPEWFWDRARYGGILVDIGCHQIEQILVYAGAETAKIISAGVANYHNKNHPDFEDFGCASLVCDNGVLGYFRVDWFTPDGLGAWGDGRVFIVGTDGYIEIRKYIDPASDREGDHLILVNREGEQHIKAAGTCGFPFFGNFIRDCLGRAQTAMTQEHVFTVMELAISAQEHALASGVGGFKG